ncbi:hypothetical protein FSP39_025427 [Pinctada imbricata]|uniref:Macro domain-containing protein n=1 Tax=Pinctada imbricata TaxID=66713 RepID=A0AA88YRP2_PINIB|nr:hypothetical protein FSP39_025427 [Pinctada imbricata]
MAEGGPKTVETSNEKNYHSDFGLVRKEDRSNLADNDSAGLDYENDLIEYILSGRLGGIRDPAVPPNHVLGLAEKEETEGLMAMDTSILIKPWDRTAVKLVVKQPLDDKPNFVTLDYDAEPFCIQYLVHCGRDILHQLADKAGCKLKVQPNCLEFWLVKDPAQTDVQAIRRQLTKGLKENVNRSDLEGHHLYARDEHDIQTKFLAQIEENPPRQIKAKEGVLLRKYDKPDVFVLVGKKEVIEETYQILNDFLKKAKRNKEKVIKMDGAKAEMVERLNLLEVLNSQLEDKNIKCRLEGQMIICEGQPKFLENCEEMFDLLYQNIRKEELCLKSEDLPVIRISDCEIEEFVMKGLKDSGIECLVHVLSGSLVLYAWKDDMIRKGKENIKECLIALRQQGEGNNAEGSNVTQKSQHTSGIHGNPNTIQKTEESSFSSDSAKFCSNPAIASSSKENSPAVHSANITSSKQQNEMDGSYQTKPREEMATGHHGDKDVMAKGVSDDTQENKNGGLKSSEAVLSEDSKKPRKRLNSHGYLETDIDMTGEVNVGLARSKSNVSPGHMVSSPMNNANMSSKLNTEKDHMKDKKEKMKKERSATKNEEIRAAEADLHPGNEDEEKHDDPSADIGSQENVNTPNVQVGENVRVPLLENDESIHKESGIVAGGNTLHRNLLAVDVLKDEGDGTAGLNDQSNGSKAVRSSSMPVNTQGQDFSNTDGDDDLLLHKDGVNPLQKVENKTKDMNHRDTAASGSISSAKVKTDTDSGNNMSGGNKTTYLSMRDTMGYKAEENGQIHSAGIDSKDSSENNLKPVETLQTLVDANDAEKVVGENSLHKESTKSILRTDSQHEVMNKGIANEKSRKDTGAQPMEKLLMAPTCQEMIRTSEPSEREGLPTPASNFDSVSESLPREMKNQDQIGHMNGEKYSSNVPSPGKKRHHPQSSGKQLEPNSEIEGEEQNNTRTELAKSTLIEKQYDMDIFWFKLLEMESVRTEITERLKSRLEAGSHISWHTAVENERCMLYITTSSVENCEKCRTIVMEEMLVEFVYSRKEVLSVRASLDELKTTCAIIEEGFVDLFYIGCLDIDSEKIQQIMNLSNKDQNNQKEDVKIATDTKDCVAKRTRSKMKETKTEGKLSKHASKSEHHIQFAADILDFLKFHDKDTLKSLQEKFKVEIQFTSSGICLQGYAKHVEEAKTEMEKARKKILSEEVKCEDHVQGDLSQEDIGNIIQKTKESCKEPVEVSCIGLDKTEPSYYCTWYSDQCKLILIVTFGRVENTKADAMVFPCSSDLNPVGTKAWDIIRKGGVSNILDSIKQIKDKKRIFTSEVLKHCEILLSEQTGNLDLQNLIFARIPAWTNESSIDAKGLDGLCKELLKVINEQGLRRVVVPVDISSDFVYEEFSKFLAYSLWNKSMKELKHQAEIHFCVSTKEKAEILRRSCNANVGSKEDNVSAIIHYVGIEMLDGDDVSLSDREVSHTCVKLHKGSLVDMDSEVDVIVNSTNTDLILNRGFVSGSLLKKAGESIQSECNKMSPIGIGEVVPSGAGYMKCKEIYHGVLLSSWIPAGNFSLHVMRCVMLKCLLKAENSGYTSIAFPALGTGKLGYPWHNVAETMFDVVDEYFNVVPSSCIKMVYFVLQSQDENTIRAFEFKEKVREAKTLNTEEPKGRDVCDDGGRDVCDDGGREVCDDGGRDVCDDGGRDVCDDGGRDVCDDGGRDVCDDGGRDVCDDGGRDVCDDGGRDVCDDGGCDVCDDGGRDVCDDGVCNQIDIGVYKEGNGDVVKRILRVILVVLDVVKSI